MRDRVDGTALDDVYTHFDEAKITSTPAESGFDEVLPESESQADRS